MALSFRCSLVANCATCRKERLASPELPGIRALCLHLPALGHCNQGCGFFSPSLRIARCRMAAYHWEARRRQIIMEHRLRLMQESRIPEESEQQVSKEKTQNCTIPLGSNMTSQNLPAKEINQERCLCQTEHVPSQSGKLLKRYKSLDYIQQW